MLACRNYVGIVHIFWLTNLGFFEWLFKLFEVSQEPNVGAYLMDRGAETSQ